MKQPSKKQSSGKNKPLPKVNVEYATGDISDMTEDKLRGMIANPIYAGLGPYPALIDDEQWIRSALTMIDSEGAAQFLVNMLYVLRQSLAAITPDSTDE
jgi:hypothetical protein